MESVNSHSLGGSLQISSEVIEKIARLAAAEVEGVSDILSYTDGGQGFLGKLANSKAIRVTLRDDVAEIEVSLVVDYGTKIPEVSELVQKNVKDAVQNMTSITVTRVDVIIAGLNMPQEQ